jgi:hypothetical protein
MTLRALRAQHAAAVEKARLYPGRGWGKRAARLNFEIMSELARFPQPEKASKTAIPLDFVRVPVHSDSEPGGATNATPGSDHNAAYRSTHHG